MITVLDYDAGNIKSVEKALNFLGEEVKITRDRSTEGIVCGNDRCGILYSSHSADHCIQYLHSYPA